MASAGPAPAFLVLPEPGDLAYGKVLKKVRIRLLGHLLSLGTQHLRLRPLTTVLADVARRHPETVLSAIGLHDVLPLLACHQDGLTDLEALTHTAIPTLLTHLAHAGVLPEAVLWDTPLARVIDAPSGVVHRASTGPLSGLLADQDGIEIRVQSSFCRIPGPPCADISTERVHHTIVPGLHLSTVDTNPLAMVEAHPEKGGNALSLGDRPLAEWQAALHAAVAALDVGLPEWVAALPAAPLRLVPVGFEPERHLSASYREALGVAYLTLHPSTLTLAEAMVHESQHTRLNTLLHLDRVLENGRTTWTPSPVRPDLRPLNGVLLAVHAFVPVAVFHARLAAMQHPLALDPTFENRRAAVLVGNDRGLSSVRKLGRATALGARVVSAIERVHAWTCDAYPGGLAGAQNVCSFALPEGLPINSPPC